MQLEYLLGIAILLVADNVKNAEARMTMNQLRSAMVPFTKSCAAKTGLSKELVEGASKGIYPDDPVLKCYQACLLGKLKILGKDNSFTLDAAFKQVDITVPLDLVEPMKAVIKKCTDAVTSDDTCVKSWQFSKCYYTTDPSLYFF